MLDTLENSSKRGADLVGQVLTFARGLESKRAAINLRHLAKEFQKVVLDTFPKNVEFEFNRFEGTLDNRGGPDAFAPNC